MMSNNHMFLKKKKKKSKHNALLDIIPCIYIIGNAIQNFV